MALKPCRECKKEVSSEAGKCPHCGIRNPGATGKSGNVRNFLAGLLALIVLVSILGRCNENNGIRDEVSAMYRGVGYLTDDANNRIRTFELSSNATADSVQAHASRLTSTPGQILAAYYYSPGSTIPADGVTLAKTMTEANRVLYDVPGLSKWRYAYMKNFGGDVSFVDCDATPRSDLCRQK
jgi:hypothetical protein